MINFLDRHWPLCPIITTQSKTFPEKNDLTFSQSQDVDNYWEACQEDQTALLELQYVKRDENFQALN